MNFFQKAFLLTLLVAITISTPMAVGQSDQQEPVKESASKPKIVCFGDSITKRGYPEVLQKLLDVETVNAGVGGNSTAKALNRMSKDVLEQNPDIVVVFFGTNDLRVDSPKVHVSTKKYAKNLIEIIKRCDYQNAKPVLCTLPPINQREYFTRHDAKAFKASGGLSTLIEKYRSAAIKVAKDNDVPVVDLNKILSQEKKWLSSDGVHPSEKGTAIIAKHIADAVSPLVDEIKKTSVKKPAEETADDGFIHPGIAHTDQTLELIKRKIEAEEQPWQDAWEHMKKSHYADLHWRPRARAHIKRGPSNKPDIGSSEFINDANAAYTHALLWELTDVEAHAQKAAEIIDDWSSTLKSITDHDAKLIIGMVGHHYCNAAELLKHRWDGWPEKNQQDFRAMLNEIWYPVIKDFYPSANGNWDASMLQTMIAMGVFLDDREMFDRATDYFLEGQGNGAIENYFLPSGECQESGRDQVHTQMGLEFLVNTCETAWNQGVDLYHAADNRLLKGFEYTAKYNLGFDVDYEPYKSFEGRYHYKSIARNGRGRLRPMYDKVFNHYQVRKEIDTPYTLKAIRKNRPKHHAGSRGGSSLPWSSLMFGTPLPDLPSE